MTDQKSQRTMRVVLMRQIIPFIRKILKIRVSCKFLTVSEKCRVSTQRIKFCEEKRKNEILNFYPLSSYPTVSKSVSMPYSSLQV